jgi:hypothetical protein
VTEALANISPYIESAKPSFGRVLSSLAREEGYLKCHGSFDRTWWCWKFTDFSASRFQEGIYTLCYWLANPDAHDHDEAHLISLISDGLAFWDKLQHKNGSFDEAYPNEYSLAATAFTCFYIGEGIALANDKLPKDISAKAIDIIKRGAKWLANNGEYHGVLSNHLAAAAGALHVAYRLSGGKHFATVRDRYYQQIVTHQEPDEGWMLEYGGADPGYQSHGLFYLAQIYKTGDDGVKNMMRNGLAKALSFQKWFLHPDGSFGGEYASRGTCFAFPAAFEILAQEFEDAAIIAQALRQFVADNKAIGPSDMDRWNLFPMLNNYLFADQAFRKNTDMPQAAPLFWKEEHDTVKHFEKAGILLHKSGSTLYALSDLGGTIKQWDKETSQLTYSDCGYIVRRGKKIYSSQNRASIFQYENGRISLKSRLTSLPQTVLTPWRFIAFRGFTLTFGHFPKISKWVKNLLVKILIKNKKPCDILLSRVITLGEHSLSIEDTIEGLQAEDHLQAVAHHVPVHMGSARYIGQKNRLLRPIAQADRDIRGAKAMRRVEVEHPHKEKKDAA